MSIQKSPAADRLSSVTFGVYLVVSGAAILALLFEPTLLEGRIFRYLVDVTASVFEIVATTCPTNADARRVFIALLTLLTHCCGIAAVIGLARENWRDITHAQFIVPKEVREYTTAIGIAILGLGFYWYTFLEAPEVASVSAVGASYVCWHPATTWLLFTIRVLLSVIVVGVLFLGCLTICVGLFRRLTLK